MYGLPCSISFLFKLWEVFLFPVFAGAHLRQVLVDSMVDQQKTWEGQLYNKWDIDKIKNWS